MVAGRTPLPPPSAAAPAAAFAVVAVPLPTHPTSRSPLSTCGTALPHGAFAPPTRQRRQRAAAEVVVVALAMAAPALPEVWHLAPMVVAEQGLPAAAMAFEAFCATPAARRGGGGGGSGGGRRRGGPDGFVPAAPPERGMVEVMHPGWELF